MPISDKFTISQITPNCQISQDLCKFHDILLPRITFFLKSRVVDEYLHEYLSEYLRQHEIIIYPLSGCIPQFLGSELFKQGPRSAAMALAALVNWLGNTAVGLSFPTLQVNLFIWIIFFK